MKLNVMQRLALLDILPQEGSFLQMTVAAEIRRAVEFSSREQGRLQLRNTETGMSWEQDLDEGLEVDFNEGQLTVVKEALAALDKGKKLKQHHLPLYNAVMLSGGESAS